MLSTKPAQTDLTAEINGMTKRYGDTVVLDGVDLTLHSTERLAVVGPSGSGKTTLLRVMMGLVEPDSGVMRIGGVGIWPAGKKHGQGRAEARERRRALRTVGMVFQHYNLFAHLSALKNVAEPLRRVKKIPRERAYAEAADMLRSVGLGASLDAKPAQLSGGQQQRVGIARTLALEPEIVLFDEVTSALDPEVVGEVLALIESIAATRDMAMVLVTHEISFARRVAHRALMFDEGRVIEDGPAQQVLSDPSHDRTKQFLSKLLHDGGTT